MKKLNKIKAAIFSTTRAEFGILRPLIQNLQRNKLFEVKFFVGGTHVLKNFGNTINEIKKSNIKIDDIFDYANNNNDDYSLTQSMSLEVKKISNIFKKYRFDLIIVLGDRYELLPIILNAILFRKIIVHIGGGEATQGLIDEQVRNMVTKASHLHFTSSETYSKKILHMGEERKRIFNVGSLSIDGIKKVKKLSKDKIYQQLSISKKKPIVLMTYHPVTLENRISDKEQINNLLDVLEQFEFNLIITSPNNEIGTDEIKKTIASKVNKNRDFFYFDSLGFDFYHQVLRHTLFVIGNSSSGIVEVPYYKIPTVNIGIRQKNRLRHESIIDVDYSKSSIKKGILKATELKFRNRLKKMKFKFGNGRSAQKIEKLLSNYKKIKNIMLK